MPTLLSFLAGGLGALLLGLAVFLPWFTVPVGVSTVAHPPVTLLYRLVCLIAGGLVLYAFTASARARQRAAQVLAVLLAALLFFPYLVMAWSPGVAAQASWLQAQHENLTWLGGDIYNAQEYRDADGRLSIYVADPSRQVGVFKLPNWTPHAVQWGRLPEIVEWLGYSNRFCEFVNKGWVLALAGTILLLTALCRDRQVVDLGLARRVTQVTLALTSIGVVLALLPPLAAAWQLTRAREAVYRGDYRRGLEGLHSAAMCLPMIRQDTYYVAQQGMIESALGLDTPTSRLQAASRLENDGFLAQAQQAYRQLTADTPDGSTVHREAVRGLLRAAIRELNSGDNTTAAELLRQVLAEEPCNLKANYTLQLACLRLGQYDSLTDLSERMTRVYGYFNFPSKLPVLGAMKENLAYAALRQNNPTAALAAWRSIPEK